MWDTIDPVVLEQIPRHAMNGVPTGDANSFQSGWSAVLTKLDRFRKEYVEDDWDGQGAAAVSNELITSGAALARSLQKAGIRVPNCVLPSVQGTLGFEWDLEGGTSVTVELNEPDSADFFLYTPGKPIEHRILTGSVTA